MRQTDVRAKSWHDGEWVLTMKVPRLQNGQDLDPFCWICKAVSEIGSIDRLPGYGELERDMPGIDSTVIELLKTQILGLCYFLKWSKKCHEIWPSDQRSPHWESKILWNNLHFELILNVGKYQRRKGFREIPRVDAYFTYWSMRLLSVVKVLAFEPRKENNKGAENGKLFAICSGAGNHHIVCSKCGRRTAMALPPWPVWPTQRRRSRKPRRGFETQKSAMGVDPRCLGIFFEVDRWLTEWPDQCQTHSKTQ